MPRESDCRIPLSYSRKELADALDWAMVAASLRRLSWQLRRFFTNVSYRFRGVGGPRGVRPPTTLLVVVVVVLSIFLLSGGVFDILEKPLALLPKGTGWTFVYRGSLHIQTLNESIVAGLLYLLAFFGLYLLLRSTRSVYNPRQAYLMLIIGLMVTLIVMYYSISLLDSKISA